MDCHVETEGYLEVEVELEDEDEVEVIEIKQDEKMPQSKKNRAGSNSIVGILRQLYKAFPSVWPHQSHSCSPIWASDKVYPHIESREELGGCW